MAGGRGFVGRATVAGRRSVASLVVALVALTLFSGGSARAALETKAREAILIDMSTDTVLFEKAADTPYEPGSVVKLMTLELVYEAIDAGEITLETTFPISEHAWRTGGAPARTTTMFAELKSQVPVADLVRGLIIMNANDAAIAMAEGMAGSEDAFAQRMNERAQALGLTRSSFTTPTGLPGGGNRMSAYDIATLASHLIKGHPQRHRIFSEEAFTWNKIFQRNRNPLIGHSLGIDMAKSGFAEGAGHGLVASAVQNGRRLLVVVAGLGSEDARDDAAEDLLRAGFEQFESVELFAANEPVAEARVFGGSEGSVPLVSYVPVSMALAPQERELYRMRVVYDGPVPAPVSKGSRVGELHLYRDKRLVHATPLFASRDIGVGRLDQRAVDGARELLFGWW